MNLNHFSIFAGIALLFFSCTSEASQEPIETDAGLSATLDTIQEHIFDVACVACHNAQNPSGGLDLSSAQVSYDNLVEVRAQNDVASENGWMLVLPGDPDLSFLIRKLSPGLGEGAAMPLGSQQLTAFYVDLMKSWIDSGAQR